MIIKHQLHFRTEGMVKASRAYGLVPSRGFPQRSARARRSRDHFGTDSVRCKLPPLYAPVSPSPVSREASRDLWRSIGLSTMVVFKLRTSLSAHPLCPQINSRFDLHVQGKTTFISPAFQTRRGSRDRCSRAARKEEDSRASHKRRQTS